MSRKMKDSGIAWIGDIPDNWDVIALKRVKDIGHPYPIGDGDHGSIKPEHYIDEGIPYIRVQNLSWGKNLLLDDVVYISEEVNNANEKSKLRPHDILVAKTGATIGKTGIIPDDMKCANTTSSVGKVTVSEEYDYKFIFYLLSSDVCFQQMWEKARQKSAQPGFNIDDLVEFKIPITYKDEQEKISRFLDYKCNRIDNIISKTQASIEEYKKLKQSIITQAVTQGVRGDREMKDSGIDWIGFIPSEWKTGKLKSVIKLLESGTSVNAGVEEAAQGEYGVLKTSCVSKQVFNVHENKSVNKEEYDRVSCPLVKNTIIVSRMNTPELVGACGYVSDGNENIYLPDRLWQVHFKKYTNVKYIYYWLISSNVRNYYSSLAVGTSSSMQNISQDQFYNVNYVIPSIDEQSEIVKYLDERLLTLDKLINDKILIVEEMKKLKKSIIYEYVTGKKEVV